MSLQLIFILLTVLAALNAHISALKKLLPSKGQQPLLACRSFYTDAS